MILVLPKPKRRTTEQKRSLRQVKSEQKFGTSPPPVRDRMYRESLHSFICAVADSSPVRAVNGMMRCGGYEYTFLKSSRPYPDSGRAVMFGYTDGYREDGWHYLYGPITSSAHADKATSGREKVGDDTCIPLCDKHHAEQELNHDAFDRKYHIDRYELAKEYYALYLKEKNGGR